jgi:hypothetical protein
VTASKDAGVRRYYQIGVIGYNNAVNPVLQGSLAEKELVWIDELYQNPIRVEERMKKEPDGAGGVIEVKTKFPIWIDPVANGQTHMCEALSRAKDILEPWVKEYPYSYPPTVINLTDGEANDGDPRPAAQALKSLATQDGNVILLTLHVSSNQVMKQAFFPNTAEGLPDDPSRVMYEMSSLLTENMIRTAQELHNLTLPEGSKGIVYNAPIESIVYALDIGTRPANLR